MNLILKCQYLYWLHVSVNATPFYKETRENQYHPRQRHIKQALSSETDRRSLG